MVAKMTKTQAQKRLMEASAKIMNVQMAYFEGKLGAGNIADMKKLFPMMVELRKIANRIK
tara:strand:- start:2142 stop:2321 length:180 start_codon:yes stop_codon:yes gene_type:complete